MTSLVNGQNATTAGDGDRNSPPPPYRARWIAAIYAIIATLWIYFSDKALTALIARPRVLLIWSTYKGIAFVVVTSLVLLVLMQRAFEAIEKSYRQREEAQNSDRESKRLLQLALDALSVQIAVLNGEGEIITANKTWLKFSDLENSRFKPSALKGSNLKASDLEAYSPQHRALKRKVGTNYLEILDTEKDLWAGKAPALAKAIREVIAGQRERFSQEYTCRKPYEKSDAQEEYRTAKEQWFNVSLTRFPGDGPPRVIIAVEDITDRKYTEIQLKASEENLATSQQMAHLGSWEMDLAHPEEEVSESPRWSDELFRIFGYEPGSIEPSKEHFFRAVHPDDRNHLSTFMTKAIQGMDMYSLDHRIILPDGTERFVHSQAELIRDKESGQPLRVVGSAQDITDRKHADMEQTRLVAQLENERLRTHNVVATIPGVVWETRVFADGSYRQEQLKASEETSVWKNDEVVHEVGGEVVESTNQRTVFVSEYATTLLGYSIEKWLSTPDFWLSIIHPDDKERAVGEAAAIFAAGQGGTTQYRWVAADGRVFWMEGRMVVVKDDEGHTIGMRGVSIDISERMRAELALLRLRDELEERVERRTAQLMEANAALQIQIVEREQAEVESKNRARQQEAVAQLGQRALADTEMDLLLQEATSLVTTTLEVEISSILELMPSGNNLRFRASSGWKIDTRGQEIPSHPQSQAGYGLLHNSPTIVQDLRSETRFQPSPRLLQSGMVSGVTVLITGPDRPFGTLSAYTSQLRAFTQDDVNFMQSMSNVLAAALEQWRTETEIRQLNFQLEESNEQLRIENVERRMVLGALEEASRQFERAKEEAEEARKHAEKANLAKSEFLSRMSHELRTPLNAILGFGQILERQELDDLTQESVNYILKGGRHLLDLINEVLDISRVEAGRLDISLEPIALADILEEACTLIQPLAAEHDIRLKINFSDVAHVHVLADQQRLKQVLINVLGNAIKYNREGGRVDLCCFQKDDERIAISVTDTGQGISAENLPKLFIPFERLGAARSNIEGTGLGLTLSLRLVEAMGGTLEVESTEGRGSTFTLTLPHAVSLEGTVVTLLEEKPESQIVRKIEQVHSVLYIEDNPSNLRLVEAILIGRPDIQLLTAMQGSIGLDLARQHQPNLILLDLHLPDLHGKEVLDRLRQGESTKDIPVIIVSADATSHQIERLLAAGAKAYLTKPLQVEKFLLTMDKLLDRHKESAAESES